MKFIPRNKKTEQNEYKGSLECVKCGLYKGLKGVPVYSAHARREKDARALLAKHMELRHY